MYRQISEEEAIGKIVKDIVTNDYPPSMIISFTDETFLYFDKEFKQETDLLDFSEQRVVRSGVATKKELDKLKKERASKNAKVVEQKERVIYEILKAKFEGQS